LKKSIERSQDGQEKKTVKSFIEENYQGGIQQRCCIDRMIRGLIRNIGDVGKKYREKEYWK